MSESRRSTRLKAKPAIEYNEPDDKLAESGHKLAQDDKEPASKRRKKRASGTPRKASTSGQNSKGKKAKLAQLPLLPLDLLYEIFGHLRPYDLLRLARTTKALRDILMRRSAISIWKDARASIAGFPETPDDMDEPQYAHLAFEPFCTFCDAPNVQTVMWECRVRSCQKCIGLHFVRPNQAEPQLRRVDYHRLSLTRHLILATASANDRKLYRVPIYLQSDLTHIIEGLESLKNNQEGTEKFIQERKDHIAIIRSHAHLCEDWLEDFRSERSQELADLKKQRREAILERLKDLGWEEELAEGEQWDSLAELVWSSHVDKPQALTNRIWANIKGPVIAIVEQMKEQRMRREYLSILEARQLIVASLFSGWSKERPAKEILPGIADICSTPDFKTIIMDTPTDTEVNEASFQSAIAKLPDLVHDWRIAKDAELLQILATGVGSQISEADSMDPGQLNRATVYFACKSCGGGHPICYPRILVHKCISAPDGRQWSTQSDGLSVQDHLWGVLRQVPWNLDNKVSSYHSAAAGVTSILETLKLDPGTTTSEQLDNLDARFECLICTNITQVRLAYNWRAAVGHTNKGRQHLRTPANWKVLDAQETSLVQETERHNDKRFIELSNRSPERICCTRCKVCVPLIEPHMKEVHHVNEVAPDDYYVHLDSPPKLSCVPIITAPVAQSS